MYYLKKISHKLHPAWHRVRSSPIQQRRTIAHALCRASDQIYVKAGHAGGRAGRAGFFGGFDKLNQTNKTNNKKNKMTPTSHIYMYFSVLKFLS